MKTKEESRMQRKIMYIDMAYTYKMVVDRQLDEELHSRSCDGYFQHIWGVHPIADLPATEALSYEGFQPSVYYFSDNQTIIEGKTAYYKSLKAIFPLNFIVSQTKFIRYLIKLVKKEKIDIVMATDPYFSGLVGLFVKMFTKAKLAIWVVAHNDDIFKATGMIAMPRLFKYRWIEKIIDRLVFRSADLVAGGNQNNLEFALDNGAKKSKSTVFPVGKLIHKQHALEPTLRESDSILDNITADNVFIYVGRMTTVKYPDDVIRAFQLIQQSEPNSALIMAGDGPMFEEVKQLSVELGIIDKVFFAGNVNQMRLANILARCNFVLSPLTGRSLIECALGRLAIIAYDRDWQPEFINRTQGGVIVPFRDWKRMAAESIRLINDPAEAQRLSENARAAGLEACNYDKLYAHEQAEFEKMLAS